jgi:hypothetical protein
MVGFMVERKNSESRWRVGLKGGVGLHPKSANS